MVVANLFVFRDHRIWLVVASCQVISSRFASSALARIGDHDGPGGAVCVPGGALEVWPNQAAGAASRPRRKDQPAKQVAQCIVPGNEDFHGMLDAFWQRFGRWVIRHNAWVRRGPGMLVITCFAGGVVRSALRSICWNYSTARRRILQDYRWLEKNVGRLVTHGRFVIRFAKGARWREPKSPGDRMTIVSLVGPMGAIVSPGAVRCLEERFGANG